MKTFMKALFAFDTILNVENPKNVSKKSIFIIEHLIAQKLKRESNVTFPPFIVDCFHAFTQNKTQITVDAHTIVALFNVVDFYNLGGFSLLDMKDNSYYKSS